MYIDEKCANRNTPQVVKSRVSEEWLVCCKFTV